jgi:hypothetical protein
LVRPRNGGAYHRRVTSRTATLDLPRLPVPAARYARPARDGAFLAGLAFAFLIGIGLLPFAVDAHAYWAANPLDPYSGAALPTSTRTSTRRRSPRRSGRSTGCPWPIFAGLWTAAIVVAFRWLSGLWLGLVMLLPPVFIEVAMGNIHAFIAVAIVIGLPLAGDVGVRAADEGHAGRRGAVVRGAPRVAEPGDRAGRDGRDRGRLVRDQAVALVRVDRRPRQPLQRAPTRRHLGRHPLLARLPVAALIVVWAARTDRRWLVPVAAVIAMPVMWPNSYSVLVAVIPLLAWDRARAAAAAPPVATPATTPAEA